MTEGDHLMTACGLICRCGAVLVAILAVLVGSLVAGVPGQLGLWRYLDKRVDASGNSRIKGVVPFIHSEPWGFNHSTLGPEALKGRIFAVTGANVGLGLGTVQYLALHGGTVIMGCRSQSNCDDAARSVRKDAPGVTLIPLVLDLSSFKSIKQFAENVHQKTQKLHSLILNAGIMQAPFGLTTDGIEQQIGVNHFGHAYLVQLLEDLLKLTATKELPATLVVVSSASHFQSYPEGVRLSLATINDPSTYNMALAYGQSKLANILFAQQQAERLKPYNVLVNALHPGVVDTELARYVGERIYAAFPSGVDLLNQFGLVQKIRTFVASLIWSPKDAALTQVYAAVSPDILSKHITGKYFHPIARETLPDRVHATNTTLQKQFWDFTQEVLKSKAK
jgi:NAD(P)-dependent dehydrogenase (short-subunit alcohol dehydrogenase family)